jgi:hypothetical protein
VAVDQFLKIEEFAPSYNRLNRKRYRLGAPTIARASQARAASDALEKR